MMYSLKVVHDLRTRGVDATKDERIASLWEEFKNLSEDDQQIIDQAYCTLLNTGIFRNFGSMSAFNLTMEVARCVRDQRLRSETKRWRAPIMMPEFCKER